MPTNELQLNLEQCRQIFFFMKRDQVVHSKKRNHEMAKGAKT